MSEAPADHLDATHAERSRVLALLRDFEAADLHLCRDVNEAVRRVLDEVAAAVEAGE